MTRKHFVFVFLLLAATGWSKVGCATSIWRPAEQARYALTEVQRAEAAYSKKHNGTYTSNLENLTKYAKDTYFYKSINTIKKFNPTINVSSDKKHYTITVNVQNSCYSMTIFTATEKQLSQKTEQETNKDTIQKCMNAEKIKEALFYLLTLLIVVICLAFALFCCWIGSRIIFGLSGKIPIPKILSSFIAGFLSTLLFVGVFLFASSIFYIILFFTAMMLSNR